MNQQLNMIRQTIGHYAWPPLLQLSRTLVLSTLRRIEHGQLSITDYDGNIVICGSEVDGKGRDQGDQSKKPNGTAATSLVIYKEAFWIRVCLFADMGFAESYMLGEFSCPDLTAFFQLFIINRSQLSNATTLTSSLAASLTGIARKTNTLANARLNVSAHYDISNAMFAAFLSEDMTYSCPIWAPVSEDRSGIGEKEDMQSMQTMESLESAQARKLDYFIEAAKLRKTDHVLEIGTGWGSFAIAAVRKTGCRITSVTLSREQKVLADERIAKAGYTNQIEVILCDYRALPKPRDGFYDKIVSIEMLEAVGREYLDTYFRCIHDLLKPNGGIGVFQCITMPENRYEAYSKGEDFIRKYIFPGGHLPTVTQLVNSVQRGSDGNLIVDRLYTIGGHYAKTLRLWREKFERNFENEIRPALLAEHEGMQSHDVELFRRKWQYYFSYCEAGFSTKTLGDVIMTIAREGTIEMLEGIPL